MPRVVPSQIVDQIDAVLSSITGNPGMGNATALSVQQSAEIAVVVELISELPNEFMVLSGTEYSEYRVAINAIKELLNFWQTQPNAPILNRRAVLGVKCLENIRNSLMKCPDEIPSQATTELLFIADADLRDSIRNDISAANRALVDGLWKAATVLAGAAAEALLLWAITVKKTPAEWGAARSAAIPKASPDPNDWGLDGYIKVAKALTLIDDETERQADIARTFRNLIHPGRSARLAKVCDKGTAHAALAAVEFIVRDLS
jgi:hypothetical protein